MQCNIQGGPCLFMNLLASEVASICSPKTGDAARNSGQAMSSSRIKGASPVFEGVYSHKTKGGKSYNRGVSPGCSGGGTMCAGTLTGGAAASRRCFSTAAARTSHTTASTATWRPGAAATRASCGRCDSPPWHSIRSLFRDACVRAKLYAVKILYVCAAACDLDMP